MMIMSRMMQVILQCSVVAVALAICICPTQQSQPYHSLDLMEERTSSSIHDTLNSTKLPPPNLVYGIFYLVQQWPKTFCFNASFCRGPVPNTRFTIHGLWPQSANGSRRAPRLCCKDEAPDCKFNQTSMEEVSKELGRVWPNLGKNGTNERFWESQWDKHGSCSRRDVHQLDYFKAAVKLYETFDLFTILKDIIKNNTNHEIGEIKDAIIRKTKVEPLFRCQFHNDSANYISEIILCVNHEATGFLSCDPARDTPSPRSECKKGKSVKFP